MTLLGRLVESRSLENPLIPISSPALAQFIGLGAHTKAGVSVNEGKALTISAVWRAVRVITSAANLPLEAYKVWTLEPVAHPIVRSMNPTLTNFEVKETIFASLALWGNAYCYKQRSPAGKIIALVPIDPGRVKVHKVDFDKETRALMPSGKLFEVTHPTKSISEVFDETEILHIPGLSYNGIVGISPIGCAAQSLGVSIAAEEYGARFYGSGSLMSGVLTTDQSIDQAAADALKKRWQDKVAGVGRSHEVVVLDKGAKFQQISIPPADAQFLESRRFQIEEVARWFDLPPHLLFQTDKSTTWGSGLEQQTQGAITFGLQSYLTRVEERFSKEVITDPEVETKFNLDGLLRGDSAARSSYYASGYQNGWLSIDEIRRKENLPPLPDGSGADYMRPLNLVSASSARGNDVDPERVAAMVQKLYLGVGKVLTVDEARNILRQTGIELSDVAIAEIFANLPPSPSPTGGTDGSTTQA